MTLEGGESLSERCETVGVILCVAGAMVPGILHGGMIAFVLGVLFNPKAFELMPLDEGGVGVLPCVFAEFILELAGVFDDREGSFDEQVGVEGTAGLGGEDLLGLDV